MQSWVVDRRLSGHIPSMGTATLVHDIGLSAWSRAHAGLMLASVVVAAVRHDPWPVAAVGAISFTVLIMRGANHFGSLLKLGPANAVTAFRLAITLAIGSVLHGARGILLTSVIIFVLALDGLDGFIARRLHLSSEFGAHFDMETDALLVLVAGVELWQRGDLGPWILTAGLLRYGYVLALMIVPPVGGSEMPRSRWGCYAFVVLISSLSAAFVLSTTLRNVTAMLGTLAVAFSFARSFQWSWSTNGPRQRVERRLGVEGE